jgi:hypothetical protein
MSSLRIIVASLIKTVDIYIFQQIKIKVSVNAMDHLVGDYRYCDY